MTSVSSVKWTTGRDIVDLFAGPRGWSTGLAALGRRDFGIEWDQAAHDTATAAGHDGILADVAALDPVEVCGTSLEGLIASPPCQGFSMAGKGAGRKDTPLIMRAVGDIGSGQAPAAALDTLRSEAADDRSALVLEPLRWALDTEPEWLAWEQVPAVLPLWEACAEVLRADGYNVWCGNLQAEQYGVPQTRKRAILLAHRTRDVGQPTPTHSKFYPRSPLKLDDGVAKWVSMAEALGGLPPSVRGMLSAGGNNTAGQRERPLTESSATITGKGTAYWQYVNGNQQNSARRDLDQPAPTIHFGERMNLVEWQMRSNYGTGGDPANRGTRGLDEQAPTVTSHIGRNFWTPTAANEGENPADITWPFERPSPTIVGSFAPDVVAAPGYRKAGDGPRQKARGSVRVTVQEAAVLQSFPPDYPWQGSKTAQYRQVGDAVPPLLAAHVLASLGVGELRLEETA